MVRQGVSWATSAINIDFFMNCKRRWSKAFEAVSLESVCVRVYVCVGEGVVGGGGGGG